jgi:hypothetical protein
MPSVAEDEAQDVSSSDKPRQMRLSEWVRINKRLLEAGVDPGVAQELVERVQEMGRSPRYVEAWVAAYLEGLEAKRVRGPGWLVTALRDDWDLPKAYKEMAMTDEERRKRYINGEFAEFIEH